MPPRSAEQRKADVLATLEGGLDVWVATADDQARPHLVPLSLCWDGDCVIAAVEATSRTAQNLAMSGHARLAAGTSRDVVMIDAEGEVLPAGEVPDVAEAYIARTGWDPRQESSEHAFLLFAPVRVQAWRDVAEIAGRTLMRRGKWIV